MTGEITLRGLVLPIGGLKEKTLAAKRAGIKHVIVPRRNEKDMPDLPPEVKDALHFHFVENVDEVLEIALSRKSTRKTSKSSKAPAKSAGTKTRTRSRSESGSRSKAATAANGALGQPRSASRRTSTTRS